MLPARITLNSKECLTVHLREAQLARRAGCKVVVDVNEVGQWIRGIKLLASHEFDLASGVRPFNSQKPLGRESSVVTYDDRAGAAFLHFSMKSPDTNSPQTDLKRSRSINSEAELALDLQGGLIWLRFSPGDANVSSADFVSLIDAPLERFTAR